MFTSLIVLFGVALYPSQANAQDPEEHLDDAVRAAAAWVAPSLVRIETTAPRTPGSPGSDGSAGGPSSGLVVGSDGWIVTSAFGLADRPAGVVVWVPGASRDSESRRYGARIVGTDFARNLTLLKIDAANLPVPTAVPKAEMRSGQWAVGLGRAWTPDAPSIAVGIISALERIWGRAIQTDAKTSPTNYGGPLIDLEGRVFGVIVPLSPQSEGAHKGAQEGTTAGATAGVEWYDSGIGFAIPLEDILANLERLKQGDLHPGLSGIRLVAESALLGPPIVARSAPGSPAYLAKLAPGDLVTSVDDRPVARIADFRQAMGQKLAGERVRIGLRRDGQTLAVELGLVAELPRYVRPYLGIGVETGPVTVHSVFAASPAARGGIKPGDIVTTVNGQPLADANGLEHALDLAGVGKEISLALERDGQLLQISVPLVQFPDEVGGSEGDPPIATVPRAADKFDWSERRLVDPLGRYYVLADTAARRDLGLGTTPMMLLGTGEADQAAWSAAARRWNLLVARLEPSLPAEWRPFDTRRLEAAVLDLAKNQGSDARRLTLVAGPDGASLAESFASAHPERVRGIVLVGQAGGHDGYPFDPAAKQAYLYVFDPSSAAAPAIRTEAARLRKLGFPVATRELNPGQAASGESLLDPEVVDWIARWVTWTGVY